MANLQRMAGLRRSLAARALSGVMWCASWHNVASGSAPPPAGPTLHFTCSRSEVSAKFTRSRRMCATSNRWLAQCEMPMQS